MGPGEARRSPTTSNVAQVSRCLSSKPRGILEAGSQTIPCHRAVPSNFSPLLWTSCGEVGLRLLPLNASRFPNFAGRIGIQECNAEAHEKIGPCRMPDKR